MIISYTLFLFVISEALKSP